MTKINRSAETGKFVSREYADQHPATTVEEEVERSSGRPCGLPDVFIAIERGELPPLQEDIS